MRLVGSVEACVGVSVATADAGCAKGVCVVVGFVLVLVCIVEETMACIWDIASCAGECEYEGNGNEAKDGSLWPLSEEGSESSCAAFFPLQVLRWYWLWDPSSQRNRGVDGEAVGESTAGANYGWIQIHGG